MKKFLSLILCALLVFSFAGCSPSEETEELLSYINEDLSDLSEIEEEFLESYESVRGDNYVDDETMYEEYSTTTLEILEKWEKESGKVANDIDDSKIRDVHSIYGSYITKYRNAINTMLGALEEQDRDEVTKANDLLNEASKLATKFSNELDELCEEYGVEIERK